MSTEGETTAADGTTLASETTAAGETTSAGETTEPVAVCGNDVVEDGEDCDGTSSNGATCESLGFSATGLMCVGCQLDASGCGPPPGMVEVSGGTFEMGSDANPEEMPIRQVHVDRFWIDETEVTVEAYAACVDAGGCSEPSMDADCNWMVVGRELHAVNCVDWFQAEEYCGWADAGAKRLPTEAEWEKAARSTDAREYPWGDSPEPSCRHVVMNEGGSGCGTGSTRPVGSKPMGDAQCGAHDMAGNVWEWVADWYGDYDEAETDNPIGPGSGTSRVARGGSWIDDFPGYFRAAFRLGTLPTDHSRHVGFRCARTPPAPL